MKKLISILLVAVISLNLNFGTMPVNAERPPDWAYYWLDRLDGAIYLDGYGFTVKSGNATIVAHCPSQKNVVIPSKIGGYVVTKLAKNSFKDDDIVEDITIPSTVTHLNNYAFSFCSNLKILRIGKSVKYIGKSAVDSCFSLIQYIVSTNNPLFADKEGVIFDKTFTTLVRFPCGRADFYHVPFTVKVIEDGAFSSAYDLQGIVLNENLIEIGSEAFNYCKKLKEITITKNLQIFGRRVFIGCVQLKNFKVVENCRFYSALNGVLFNKAFDKLAQYPPGKGSSYTIPENIKIIGHDAFNGCTILEQVIIPEGLTNIDAGAFSDCENLTGMILPASVKNIGIEAFKNSVIKEISIPTGVEKIAKSTFSMCQNLKKVTMPDTITNIDDMAFLGCCDLLNIRLSKNLVTIGENAFNGSGVRYIGLPSSLEKIEKGAFSYTDLRRIVIPSGIKAIEDRSFCECEITKLVIGKNVTKIGKEAFLNNRLTSVSIPAGVTSIGEEAFGCHDNTWDRTIYKYGKFKSIYFYGDAPRMGRMVFAKPLKSCRVFHIAGKKGFTNPWHNYKTAIFLAKPVISGFVSDNNGVVIKWNKVQGATGYYIYRTTESAKDFKLIGTSNTIEFLDKGFINGEANFYKIRAYRISEGKKIYSKYSDSKGLK